MSRANAYGWYVIFVLSLITLLSQLDRHFPSLLVQPLKAHFAINDTQFSLLHGYAFAVTYALMGIPLGRLVDRANRRNLLVAGPLVWTMLTAASAFAQSYAQLFVARMGVGIGEAVLAPAAYSLIADYFPPERRGKAIAVYFTSLTIGSGLAMVGGGAMLRMLPANGLEFPVFGWMETWQAMFLMAGLPGLALVWLLLTIREPLRLQSHSQGVASSFADFLRFVWANFSVFGRIIGAGALFAVVGNGVLGWAPALFERAFAVAPPHSALTIGALMMAGGTIGPLCAGWLSDGLTERARRAARLWPLVAGAALLIGATGWAVMPTAGAAIALLGLVIFAMGMINASMPIILQQLAPGDMRGQIIALYLLVVSLIGAGFGPMAVGLLTDYLFASEAMLPWSLFIMSLPAACLGAWLCWRAMEPYERLNRDLNWK
jgi:MFS family permease